MRARLLRLSNDLRESYWFVLTMMAVGALLLALALIADRIASLARQTRKSRALAEKALDGACREAVLARADDLLRALAEPDYERRLRDANA